MKNSATNYKETDKNQLKNDILINCQNKENSNNNKTEADNFKKYE